MLATGMYPTQIHYMAKKLFEGNSKIGSLKCKCIPCRSRESGMSTLKIPSRLLKEGKVVGIFPSGTRSAEDVSLKAGAVTIAMRSNVPLVPATYVGSSSVKRINKGKKAKLIFGDPIQIEAGEQIDRKPL